MYPKDYDAKPIAGGGLDKTGECTEAEPIKWTPCGAHRFRVDNDTFVIELHGEFTDWDLEEYFLQAEKINRQHGYFMVLGDISRGVSMGSDIRKRSAQWIKELKPLTAMAVIGAPLAARAVVTLAVQAIRLFSRDEYHVEFHKDEATAREWLAKQRQHLRQRAADRKLQAIS